MRKIRKIAFYLLLLTLAIVAGLTTSVLVFKDRIIQQFIREANKNINTPIKISKIDVSAWNDFPNLSIVFHDVYIEDSHPGTYPLLTAKTISFSLNALEVWQGKYTIQGMRVVDSETNLKINAEGESNYTITKKSKNENESIRFDLKNAILKNSIINYHDQRNHQHHIFKSDQLKASIDISDDKYQIESDGNVTVLQIGIGNQALFKDKTFDVTALLEYDNLKKIINIKPSTLALRQSTFIVKGNYSFKEKNEIDLIVDGTDANIQTLVSLVPEKVSEKLKAYKSDGDVFFNLSLKGQISDRKSPFVSVSFGFKDATFSHPEYKVKITHANLDGSFASPSLSNFDNASLFLKNVRGELNSKSFESSFSVQNFQNPMVDFQFKGDLDATSLQDFYPKSQLKELSGQLKADISLSGEIELLKKKSTAQRVKTDGSVELIDFAFNYGEQNIPANNLNGVLQFNNNDLSLSDLKGKFGRSDFLVNGFFKNIVTYLLFENQPVGIEADLKSTFLDLDQLFEMGFGETNSEEYKFKISPNIHFNFNCDVKSMKFKRFAPRNIKGDLLVKNQMAISRNISFDAMGGHLSLNGIVDANNEKAIDVVSSFKLKDVHLDSIFYVFENFHQGFIKDKHLKGETTADVNLEMTLNEKLQLSQETLIADISANIKKGELNDFEPLKQLNKYLDDESLSRLRFGDLKNDIHIENKVIYVPPMEIKSNVTSILVRGKHTFDHHIDYRVTAPLRSKKKIDPDEAFGAIEDDGNGQMKVYLKIVGTTDNYEVSLDKEAMKKKIAGDFKQEVQELKDAFKLKGKKKKKELELEKEDYFDWEED